MYVIATTTLNPTHFLTDEAWRKQDDLVTYGGSKICSDPIHARQFDTFQEALEAYAMYAYGRGVEDSVRDGLKLNGFNYRIVNLVFPKYTYRLVEVS